MPVNSDLTEAQVREFFTTLSNWGKWGPNDQFGALNYITPAKRAQAAALVREGVSVSLSLPLATRPSPDNPTPVTHLMLQTGAPGETEMVPLPYSADYFAISPTASLTPISMRSATYSIRARCTTAIRPAT